MKSLSCLKDQFRSFFICLLFLSAISASAQQFNLINFNVEEGLPQSTVWDIFQDHEGYLWVGTDGGGLCRYDGFRFKTYGSLEGLEANSIRRIAQDKEHNLWVATNMGLYHCTNGKFSAVDEITDNRSTMFMSVFVDKDNGIWAGTTNKGLFKITKNEKGECKAENFNADNGLMNNFVAAIGEDAKGDIWISSFSQGVNIFNKASKKFRALNFPTPAINEIISFCTIGENEMAFGTRSEGAWTCNLEQISSLKQIKGTEGNMVWGIDMDLEKNIFVSTDKNGVVCTNKNYSVDQKKGLVLNNVLRTLHDREGNLWIGTNGSGMVKYSGNKFIHFTSAELPLLYSATCILKDKNNDFWAGSESGLYQFTFSEGDFNLKKHYTSKNGLTNDKVTCLGTDLNGVLWVGTESGVNIYQNGSFKQITVSDGLVGERVNAVFADSKEQMWIGTRDGLTLIREDGSKLNMSEGNGLANNEVQCFGEDGKGNVWIGTFNGLIRYDGKVLQSYDRKEGLFETKIHSLCTDKQGDVFIGTFGGGIYKYKVDGGEKPISKFCRDELLLSGSIYSLLFENDSILIAGTNKGLCKLHLNEKGEVVHVGSLDKFDGFKFVEANLNAAYNNNGKEMWFGTPKGISVFYPELDKLNLVKPVIFIDELKVNGEDAAIGKKLDLSSSQNSIKLAFTAVSLTNPHNNLYYAKLSGLDTSWNRLVIDRQNLSEFISVEYKKLQPGDYKLMLRACNNDGIFSETTTVEFHIEKPFYKKTWFIVVSIALILLLFFSLLKLREKKLQKEKEVLEGIVVERTAEIVAKKQEIEAQKDLLEIQKHEITDSINYSKRIQNAILPEMKYFDEALKNAFILYKPRDIVSGDFYHFGKLNDGSFFVAGADCTGHGVPGAFMSMIGSKELSEAIKVHNDPGNILGALNRGMKLSLKQSNSEVGIRDGMDIAVVSIHKKSNGAMVKYAGANRPFWLVRAASPSRPSPKEREAEINEIKATKTAIGGFTEDDQVFEQHSIELNTGDTFYLFSDGYADQFGGDHGKKMMTKRFKEVLLEINSMSMHDQQVHLLNYFDSWKGAAHEQVDDVLVIGIKI
jgi:ligand-binding sensor domain-containing protein/serine phosphatase RsbU (regulator of sigma subunit)